MLAVAKAQLALAALDGVDTVIFQCHERFSTVKPFTRELLAWKARHPKLQALNLPVVFASHDHLVYNQKVGDTRVIDSGTNYAFTALELSETGSVENMRYLSPKQQKQFAGYDELQVQERKIVTRAEKIIARVTALQSEIIGTSIGYADTRPTMEQGRGVLGMRLTDALIDWSNDSFALLPDAPEVAATFAFFNSGSYRYATPIPAGDVTRAQIIGMNPFEGGPVIYVLEGKHIQSMYEGLRKQLAREKVYTPQISSNLNEGEDMQLLTKTPEGKWVPLDPNQKYILVLGSWLGRNGFKVPEFAAALPKGLDITPPDSVTRDVLMKYLPKHLAIPAACESELELRILPVP